MLSALTLIELRQAAEAQIYRLHEDDNKHTGTVSVNAYDLQELIEGYLRNDKTQEALEQLQVDAADIIARAKLLRV